MYTGTLIEDLMATVERAQKSVPQKRITEETELERWFEFESPGIDREPAFAGAA
jgi:hypothetical protein